MRYELIFEKGKYALIKRGEKLQEYAVVNGLDKEAGEWKHTVSYCGFGNMWHIDETIALRNMLDVFIAKTTEDYIPQMRLEEIATLEKDKLLELDEEEAMEFFDSELQLEGYEREFFGIPERETPKIDNVLGFLEATPEEQTEIDEILDDIFGEDWDE